MFFEGESLCFDLYFVSFAVVWNCLIDIVLCNFFQVCAWPWSHAQNGSFQCTDLWNAWPWHWNSQKCCPWWCQISHHSWPWQGDLPRSELTGRLQYFPKAYLCWLVWCISYTWAHNMGNWEREWSVCTCKDILFRLSGMHLKKCQVLRYVNKIILSPRVVHIWFTVCLPMAKNRQKKNV